MAQWSGFFSAEVSASAALAGLIFVSASINLARVLSPEFPSLPNRVLEALIALLAVLSLSSLLLAPAQPLWVSAVEMLSIGAADWLVITWIQLRDWRRIDRRYLRNIVMRGALAQVATLPFVAAGIVTLTTGSAGFYVLLPGVIASFALAFLDSWVLLIEINRP